VSQTPGRNARERRWPGAWQAVPLLLLSLLVLLVGCTSLSRQAKREASLSELLLTLDSTEKMGGDPRCLDRRISTTEVLGAVERGSQGVSSRWTERWTVNRCGSLIPYLVKFARAPEGDLDVTMQLETPLGEPGTVPGATLADPILQRDVLGFLAQRDFSVLGAEGTCDARKVIDTEILQPLEGAAVEGDRPIGGQWVERWTLVREWFGFSARTDETQAAKRPKKPDPGRDRCGMLVRYVVRFSTTPKGTTFTVETEP
jgi:hypothetical protein